MDMSLDDIIRNRKISVAPTNRLVSISKPPLRKTINRTAFRDVTRITDARMKIIQKNRAKIRDARDKLAEITRSNGDVRKKLTQKLESRSVKPYKSSSFKYSRLDSRGDSRGESRGDSRVDRGLGIKLTVDGGGLKTRNSSYKQPITTASLRRHNNDVPQIPRGYVDYDNMEKMEEEEYAAASNLYRTVRNDAVYEMPPPAPRGLDNWGTNNNEHYDPFDVYEVPVGSRHERHMSPDLPPAPSKGILRPSTTIRERSPDMYQRHNSRDTHLSYNMRSRLEHAPDPHASMGIFSYPSQSSAPSYVASKPPISTSGCRIVVSNLHTSVSQSDIKELFEDIGELYDSRIVRPGVAEIIYKSVEDAEKAVDTYHNRQLDGQPMKCLLVSPRASNKPTAPAMRSSGSHSSNKTPLEIDIDALHKVLFRRN